MGRLAEDFPPPPFEGFAPTALGFFRDLARHQDRTWFAAHKGRYERQVLGPLAALVGALSTALEKTEAPVKGDPKRSIFRINRDVRFAADKKPYKTHAGAVLTRNGQKSSPGVVYLHFDPQGSFAAAGFFRPEPDALHRLRTRIVEKPAAWLKMETALHGAGLQLQDDDTLVRPPKGFEIDDPALQAALKLKSWIVKRGLMDDECRDPALVGQLADFAQAAAPLLKYGWAALGS